MYQMLAIYYSRKGYSDILKLFSLIYSAEKEKTPIISVSTFLGVVNYESSIYQEKYKNDVDIEGRAHK